MKGGWNGGSKGDNGKGKGKGYQGQCWGCGQIGHKQDECPNQHQRVQQVQPVQQGQPAQTMGPIAFPEPVHPNSAVSPAAGFTPIGSVPVNSVWMVGNVEAHYRKQTVVQNMFSAFEDQSEDAKEDEEWPILKTSEPQIIKKARKEAFWIRAQAKEKETKQKTKEEHELMESLIDGSEPLVPAGPFPKGPAGIVDGCHSRRRKVGFCEEFMSCADTCCTNETQALERQAEGDSSSKSETPLLTAPSDEPSGVVWVPCVSEGTGMSGADLRARVMRKEASKAVEVNVIQTLESGVSRSVRWGKEAPKEINGIGDEQFTGPVAIRFNISNVQRPLAAASKVAGQGNRIVLEGSGGYIESIATGDRIALRLERGVYVFDVVLPNGERAVVALDSGAGVCVWPEAWKVDAKLEKKEEGLSMIAANGTEISNVGQKVIHFKAVKPFTGQLGR